MKPHNASAIYRIIKREKDRLESNPVVSGKEE